MTIVGNPVLGQARNLDSIVSVVIPDPDRSKPLRRSPTPPGTANRSLTIAVTLTKVADLVHADGWVRGSDGVWVRGDIRARIELNVDAASQFHALFGQIISSLPAAPGPLLFELAIVQTTIDLVLQ